MSVVLLAGAGRRKDSPAAQHAGEVSVRCRFFGPGREDWNRGERVLRMIAVHSGRLSRLRNGSLCLRGIPGVDVHLSAAQIDRILQTGFAISSSNLEIEIDADAFKRAMQSLPPSGTVHPFRKRYART